MKYLLEICAGTLSSVRAAMEGGADRIELCDNLLEGGTTPSLGMITMCRSFAGIPVFPIIRPRGGDFVYSDEEFEVMIKDIGLCRELGCEGIVTGVLLDDRTVDNERCRKLIEAAGPMQVTFHRAFDRCPDLSAALEEIIDLGFARILTSGGAGSAEEGLPQLKKLVGQAGNRITIMPGAGITEDNILKIKNLSGAMEFHGTIKRTDTPAGVPIETDRKRVAEIQRILQKK